MCISPNFFLCTYKCQSVCVCACMHVCTYVVLVFLLQKYNCTKHFVWQIVFFPPNNLSWTPWMSVHKDLLQFGEEHYSNSK